MLTTADFYQLAPTPFGRLRNRFRACPRNNFPNHLQFLLNYGVSQERINALRASAPTEDAERELAAHILLFLFENEYLYARSALYSWLNRRGGANPELVRVARRFAREFLDTEANDSIWLQSA